MERMMLTPSGWIGSSIIKDSRQAKDLAPAVGVCFRNPEQTFGKGIGEAMKRLWPYIYLSLAVAIFLCNKCARALWWQVAVQENISPKKYKEWTSLFRSFQDRWSDVCKGFEWSRAFTKYGYDILFAIEGLDMLLDSGTSIEKELKPCL
jgi:hypothetical protein